METQEQSWARWQNFQVGDAQAQALFGETLARQQGWSVAFAQHVFSEYRKFLFLALTAPHPLTPPAPIRAAWDLHRELPSWRALPERTELERRIMAGDTLPSVLEPVRALYTLSFATKPPESIWPAPTRSAKVRHAARRRHLWVAVGLGLVAITCAICLPEEWAAPLGGAIALLGWLLHWHRQRRPKSNLEQLAHAVRHPAPDDQTL